MRITTAAAPLILLAACAGPLPWEVATGRSQTMDFAFSGQSSFTELGISTGSDSDTDYPYVWVTAGNVPQDYISGGPGAFASGEGAAARPGPARLACALFADDHAAIISVPDDWQPPDDR